MARTVEKKIRARYIRTNMILPAAGTPEPDRDEDKLASLTASIAHHGMIQPVLVTRKPLELWYTLVAGRRRMDAARRLKLESVPAIVLAPEQASAAMLLENLHRAPASCFEQAELLRTLAGELPDTALLAQSFGLDEDMLRDTLCLFKLTAEEREVCRAAGIDQTGADRILALPKSEREKLFFGLLNPARPLEDRAYVLRDRMGLGSAGAPRHTIAIKDVRIFFNTIDRALELMKQAGVGASSERHDYDGFIEYLVRIPSQTSEPAGTASPGTLPGA